MGVMRAPVSPPRRVVHSFAFALTLSLAREDLARFCGDVPNGLHHAHHSRVLQSKREHVLPHALIVDRVPVQRQPPSPCASCAGFAVCNNASILAFALRHHCLCHRGCRRELLCDGEGEEGCCERRRVGANAERIKEQKWDGGCVGDLQRYKWDGHRGRKRYGGRHCTHCTRREGRRG
jgi:hypothetical protein